MGFPPIGIMSLSAVLKQAGHECLMFDQANPETPDEVIIEAIKKQQPVLIGLSFLSTTSYPYAKYWPDRSAQPMQRSSCVWRCVRESNAQLVKLQCPEVDFVCRGDGEQLLLDLLGHLDDPDELSADLDEGRQVVQEPIDRWNDIYQWPFPIGRVSLISSNPCRLTFRRSSRWNDSRRCKRRAGVPGPACSAIFRSSTRGNGARRAQHVVNELTYLEAHGYGSVYSWTITSPSAKADRRDLQRMTDAGLSIHGELKVGSTSHTASLARDGEGPLPDCDVRYRSGSGKISTGLKKSKRWMKSGRRSRTRKKPASRLFTDFLVGNPDETVEDMQAAFDFASKLPLDTFGFNRLCVYRGTPLWHVYSSAGS